REHKGKQKTEGQQSATLVTDDVKDSSRGDFVHARGHQSAFGETLQKPEDTFAVNLGKVGSNVGNECKQKDDRREDGEDKVEGHAIRLIHNFVVLKIMEKPLNDAIQGNILMAREAYPLHPREEQSRGIPLKKQFPMSVLH